jgi:hypothetical protein
MELVGSSIAGSDCRQYPCCFLLKDEKKQSNSIQPQIDSD